jgi:hypothetical protein
MAFPFGLKQGDTIFLKADNNQFLSLGTDDYIVANKPSIDQHCAFVVEDKGNGKMNLRASNDKVLKVYQPEMAGYQYIRANGHDTEKVALFEPSEEQQGPGSPKYIAFETSDQRQWARKKTGVVPLDYIIAGNEAPDVSRFQLFKLVNLSIEESAQAGA